MQKTKWTRLFLENLEERAVPATFNYMNNGTTLTFTQTGGTVGPTLTLTDDPAAGTITVTDGSGTAVLPTGPSSTLRLNLLPQDSATTVDYILATPRSGDLTVDVRNTTARLLTLTTTGALGGNLTVTGGAAALAVSEGATSPLTVGGNARFTGGNALDVVSLNNVPGSTIGGTLSLTKINNVNFDAGDFVGGDLFFNASNDASANILDVAGTTIGRNLSYTGGNGTEAITIDGASTIGQSLIVNFGTQLLNTNSSTLLIDGTAVVGGSLSVTGGNIGQEVVTLGATATVAGNITMNLGGGTTTVANGAVNDVNILGIVGGSSFSYTGGVGIDDITYQPADGSARVRFTANLGAGNDVVNFATAPGNNNPSFASIDFGAGTDTVTGFINFPFSFRNLP